MSSEALRLNLHPMCRTISLDRSCDGLRQTAKGTNDMVVSRHCCLEQVKKGLKVRLAASGTLLSIPENSMYASCTLHRGIRERPRRVVDLFSGAAWLHSAPDILQL